MADENLYAPPRGHDAEAKVVVGGDGWGGSRPFVKASRGVRLGGWLVDVVFSWALLACARMASNLFGSDVRPATVEAAREMEEAVLLSHGVFVVVATALTFGVQGWLIAVRGQSLGKVVTRTRIVLGDGRVAGLFSGFVLRALPHTVMTLLMVGSGLLRVGSSTMGTLGMVWIAMVLVDAVLIFGGEVRCLHDFWAGTFVEKLGATGAVANDDEPAAPRRKKKAKRRAGASVR